MTHALILLFLNCYYGLMLTHVLKKNLDTSCNSIKHLDVGKEYGEAKITSKIHPQLCTHSDPGL